MLREAQVTVVYGAFKAMGDLLCAAPAIISELNQGSKVVLLVFPQLSREFLDLLDFGPNSAALQIVDLPAPAGFGNMRAFFTRMARLSPAFVWLSPHSPAGAASWRIPLLLSVVKRLHWKGAIMGGADSEPMSRLFDVRLPVDRNLPFTEREWASYSSFRQRPPGPPPAAAFRGSIASARSEPPQHDVAICPGAGAENRRWPARSIASVVHLIPRHYRIALVGLPADIAAVKSHIPAERSLSCCSGTLEEALQTIARSRVALTMDSGPMFFAHTLGVPAVSLFGASDPANVIGRQSSVLPLYRRNCPCQPCGRAHCVQSSVRCMESHEPALVAQELMTLLARQESRIAHA